jgi:hypothetical protein
MALTAALVDGEDGEEPLQDPMDDVEDDEDVMDVTVTGQMSTKAQDPAPYHQVVQKARQVRVAPKDLKVAEDREDQVVDEEVTEGDVAHGGEDGEVIMAVEDHHHLCLAHSDQVVLI